MSVIYNYYRSHLNRICVMFGVIMGQISSLTHTLSLSLFRLFNALSKLNVAAENFPFCTIDPNVAMVPVPDQRFNWLCRQYKPKSEVPPTITITDIAGLVRGASEGAGLGK